MNSIYIVAWKVNLSSHGARVEKYTGTRTIAELKKAMERQSMGNPQNVRVETGDGKMYRMDDLNEQFAVDYWGGEA